MERTTTASWLCRTDAERERLLDMDRRLEAPRGMSLLLLGAALVLSAPWVGAWTLAPIAVAAGGFAVARRSAERTARPELVVAAAWVLSQLAIAVSVALSGGPDSPAVAWLVLPVVTLGARFESRGVAAGLAVTAVLMVAVTFGVDPVTTLARPEHVLFPLALLGAVGLLSTALMRSDVEHRSESVLDRLTGMLNRRSLDARVAELEQQAAITGYAVGLVVGDLDGFKAVNDEFGHARGDAVLVDVAYALRKELRAFDLAYRIGGEEFLIVLPGASVEDAADLAERLRRAVEVTFAGGLEVTMSFGVAASGGAGLRFASLFEAADAALYAAKRGGRNRVALAGDAAGTRAPVPA